MQEEEVTYSAGGVQSRGFICYDERLQGKRPAVLIAHAWRGQDDFARDKARMLAGLGYAAFAADLFGNGLNAKDNNEAASLITPLFLDRALLRERIVGAYHAVRQNPRVDTAKIGAIGFCFGGLTVIELLRSGMELKGVVSFHGLLGDDFGPMKAKRAPSAEKLHGSILILHGYEDPMVSRQDIDHMQKELTEAGVDWQMHIYGQTTHAFTNPLAAEPANGMQYNPKTAERALQSMRNFFTEVFK